MNIIKEAISIVESEMTKLQHEYRVVLPEMIQRAVELGDLRENADYKSALERQEMVKFRLNQLAHRLSELSMINTGQLPKDQIGLGSEIVVLDLDSDEEKTFLLALSEQIDPSKGWISIQSPIGSAFSGKEVGDEVNVKTPQGVKNYEILDFKTIHTILAETSST